MSVTYRVVCATCPAIGPVIGDFGYLGRPSMRTTVPSEDEEPDYYDDDERVPFGFFYQRLNEAGISTDELEAMAGFLRTHEGHLLSTSVDDSDFTPEIGNPDAVTALMNAADPEQEPLGYKELDARVRGDFQICQYTVDCACGEELKTEPTILRPLGEVRWTPQLLERFREMFRYSDESANRLTEPLIDPEPRDEGSPLPQIAAFVAAHVNHGVTARAVPSSADAAAVMPRRVVNAPSPTPAPAPPAPAPSPPARTLPPNYWLMTGLLITGLILTGWGFFQIVVQHTRLGFLWMLIGGVLVGRASAIAKRNRR